MARQPSPVTTEYEDFEQVEAEAQSQAQAQVEGVKIELESLRQGFQQQQSMLQAILAKLNESPLKREPESPSRPASPTGSVTSTLSQRETNPYAREFLRELPHYSGDTTTQELLDFIDKFSAFFEAAEASEKDEIRLLRFKLTGSAAQWWRDLREAGELPRNWIDAKTALLRRFTPPALYEHARDQLEALRQTGTVLAYNNAFNRLLAQLSEKPALETLYRYKKGLKRNIYSAIIVKGCITLAELQEAALQQEQLLESNNFSAPRRTSEAHASEQRPNQRSRPFGRTRSQDSAQKRFHKPGNKDKKPFPCTLCNKVGHPTYKCPEMARAKAALNKSDKKPEPEANLTLATHRSADHSVALDSCATHHIVKDVFLLNDLRPISPTKITVANKETIIAKQSGTMIIYNNSDNGKQIKLRNVLYAPQATRNLCSTAPLLKEGYHIKLSQEKTAIYRGNDEILPIRYTQELPFIVGHVETTAEAYSVAAEGKATTEMSLNYGTSAWATQGKRPFKLQI
jgi:hypothetical protein